ncbi:MAG: N-acetylmuramoyl-L-alanine amidase, partial [Acidobacteria bacterium]|nr:N-acetylmuramoyl-L-alanine amidase [Acidobacteriota bacterium]
MAQSGIAAIDNLFSSQNASPIITGSADREAIGLIQDLLVGHGAVGLPGLLSSSRGSFGPTTTREVRRFQQAHQLPVIPANNPQVATVDGATLRELATAPTEANANPIASRGYLTLGLDFPFTGMVKVMSLTTIFEGSGQFTAQNRNTDRQGLSYGLIQWAQGQGRLTDILRAFQTSQPQTFVNILGEGDSNLAQGLINHARRPRGGTNSNGDTIDPNFNLIRDPWTRRFTRAGLNQSLQVVQVSTALAAFNNSFHLLQTNAPRIRSERGVAFMLDLANQHGDGGARAIFQEV